MSAYISVVLQRRIRERFANCCAYCRTAESLSVVTFEFEHVVPRSSGGETTFDNLCLSCPMCNRYKSDSAFSTDPITQSEVSLFHPQRQIWVDHFSWSKDGTEIFGLSPVGRATIAALKMNRASVVRVRRMWVAMGEHPPEME